MALTVPAALLTQDDAVGNLFSSEKPINLSCGPVTFSDGSSLSMENGLLFEYLLCRRSTPAVVEIWDDAGKSWVPESTSVKPQTLFNKNGDWASILVATGQKDSADNDKFYTDPVTSYPSYFVRCKFTGKDSDGTEHTGASPDSNEILIISARDKQRAGLETHPEDISDAKEIRLYLKDAALQERGHVSIEQDGGGYRIELNVSNASITITPDGDIELTPATNRSIVLNSNGILNVNGDIELTPASSKRTIINSNVQVNGNMQVTGTVNGITIP